MTVQISRLPFKSLWNSEYTIFVNQLSNIVQKNSPDALHIGKSYSRVVAFGPDLAKIKAQEAGNAISNTLQDLDSDRDILLSAIVAQVKTMGRINIPSVVVNALVLEHFFDTHGRDIPMANYNSETKRIKDLFTDYDSKADVKAASAALNLGLLFEQLHTINTQFESQFMQRTGEVAALDKVDSRAIRTDADKALTAFFNAIEFCSSEYENLDYTPLANEINDLVAYYKTQIKSRATRRTIGKDISKEIPIAL